MTGGVLLEMFLASIYLSKTRAETERRDDVPFMVPPAPYGGGCATKAGGTAIALGYRLGRTHSQ